jgi:leader peptidase (prepilin peptidase)/N-methyltransferase
MISGLIVSFFFPEVFGYQKNLPSFIFSLFSLSASLVFMSGAVIAGKALFKRDALGWGDVKFIGAIGACLGIKAAFFTLLIGSVFGSLFGLYLILFAKKKLKTAIPFGPFLSIAAITYIFFGEPIISAYLRGCQTSPTSQTSQTNHAIKF